METAFVRHVDDRRRVHLESFGAHRLQKALELRVLVFGQAPRIGPAVEQAGPRGGRRDHQDFEAVGVVHRHRGLARRERSDDRQDLVVLRKLARADGGLARVRARVETYGLELLAIDAAGLVDRVDRDVEGGERGLGRTLQRPARRNDMPDLQDILCTRRTHHACQAGPQDQCCHVSHRPTLSR